MVLNEYNYVLETLKIVTKHVLKEYTSIGINKTTGTLLSDF